MSLRTRFWCNAAGGAVLAVALGLVASHPGPFTYYFVLLAGVVFVGLLVERFRYKKLENRPPGPEWIETEERFVDPETNRRVTVFYNPKDGKRIYVANRH